MDDDDYGDYGKLPSLWKDPWFLGPIAVAFFVWLSIVYWVVL